MRLLRVLLTPTRRLAQALAVQTACGVLVYSLLDDHGTLAVWAWTAGQPAPSVRVVEMQSVLGSVAGSWSEMLEKLHDPALAVGEPGGGERWNELMRVLYQVPGRLEHATHTAGREFGRAHCIRAMSDAHMRRRTLASLDADIA